MGAKLSICIATYNRANFIGETIESIMPQLTNEIELLIVDGASPDNTKEVVESYSYSDERIKYFRLPQKGGVDHDFCKAVEFASGDYCWLFTDDDLFRANAVKKVLSALDEGHDLVVVNAAVFNADFTKLIDPQLIKIEEDQVYSKNTIDEFFIKAINCLSFIGSVVIRRSIWLAREKEKYFGSEFIHVGVIFQKPPESSIKIIAESLIDCRFGVAQWSSRGFSIWMFKWPKLLWSFEQISLKAKKQISPKEPWRSLRTLLGQRSLGTYDKNTYKNLLAKEKNSLFWRLLASFIAAIPRRIVVFIHYVFSRFKEAESRNLFDAMKE